MLSSKFVILVFVAAFSMPVYPAEAEWTQHVQSATSAYRRGDYGTTVVHLRAAAKHAEAFGERDKRLPGTLEWLGAMVQEQGRYEQAEPLLRRALALKEKQLGHEHLDIVETLNRLASLYKLQGRRDEADTIIRHAFDIAKRHAGIDHPSIAVSYLNLAEMYPVDAEAMVSRAIEIWEKSLGPEHTHIAAGLEFLTMHLIRQQRLADAEPLLRRALAINEKHRGPGHPQVVMGIALQGVLHQARGRYAEAEAALRRALVLWEQLLGENHPNVAGAYGALSDLYHAQGRTADALAMARRATAILGERYLGSGAEARATTFTELKTNAYLFELHIKQLSLAAGDRRNIEAEAFRIAQQARANSIAEQVSRMAARFAASDDALARLARQRQDLITRIEGSDRALVRELSQPAEKRDQRTEEQLRRQLRDAQRELRKLDTRIQREFPRYRELTDPAPLTIADAQQLLAEDEALVVFVLADDASYGWVVRRSGSSFERLAPSRIDINFTVQQLRAQLDLGAGTAPEVMLSRPFDVAKAHELYRGLFGPLEKYLVGARSLLVVPDGGLQSLPLGVLVTESHAMPIKRAMDHADVPWLAKRHALVTLPSAGSLRALRAFSKSSAGSESFLGFGDPVLGGAPGAARSLRPAQLFARGVVANVDDVRKLDPLPDTADELRAIASTLKAPASSLHLREAASEARVKRMDLTPYRNIVFATHGVLAGDFKGLAEPALVLTPPAQGSELDDGLLTAGEIAQLKLDADWVILSACNTAAGDGTPRAEGLSGMAQAFFYAGARSLLVSHWAVASDAARLLTTRMFEETEKGASRADALRRAMLALMHRKDNPYFAHPAMWAPFVVVGEGRSTGP